MKRARMTDGLCGGPRSGGRCGLALALAGAFALTGCHHARRAQPVLLPPQTPVALVDVPAPQTAPLVEAQSSALPAVPTAQAAGKPKKVKKRAAKPTAPVTTQQVAAAGTAGTKKPTAGDTAVVTASAPAAKPDVAVAGIGALTVGGEQSPRALQEANELLASNERRLNSLSQDAVKAQAELVGKVRNFQKDAQVALASGDAEGAKTLAMKGKLLLDDFDTAQTK